MLGVYPSIRQPQALLALAIVGIGIFLAVSFTFGPFIALGISAAVLLLPAMFIRPRESFTMVFFLAPFLGITKAIFESRLAPAALDIVLLIVLFAGLTRAITAKHKLEWPWQALLAGLLFSLCLGYMFHPGVPDLLVGLEGFRAFGFAMLGFFAPFIFIESKKHLQSITNTLLVSATIVAIYGAKQFFLPTDFDRRVIELSTSSAVVFSATGTGVGRAFSTMSGPFHFGLFMLLSTLCLLALYRNNKVLLVLGLILFPTCLVLSLTRTTMIGLVLAVIVLILLLARLSLRSIVAVGIAVPIVAVAFASLLPAIPGLEPISDFFSSLTNLSETSSYQYRVGGWESDLLPAVMSNPWGYGTGLAKDGAGFFTSHNMYLKVLIENGVLSCTVFLLLLSSVIWRGGLNQFELNNQYLKQYNSFVLAFVLTMCILGLSGPFLDAYPVNLYFWFFAGTIFALKRLDAQQE